MSSTSTYKTIEGLRHQLQEFNGTQDTDNWVYPGHNHLGSNATNSNSNTMEQSSNRRYPQRDRHPPSHFDPNINRRIVIMSSNV